MAEPIKWHQSINSYDEDGNESMQREMFVYITDDGAVEGWRSPSSGFDQGLIYPTGYFGGIEVHSKTPRYESQQPMPTHCQWTGGTCYPDGSSMAFDAIARHFESPGFVFAVLEDWVRSAFGGGDE